MSTGGDRSTYHGNGVVKACANTKIGNLGLPVEIDEKVRWLYVPMD